MTSFYNLPTVEEIAKGINVTSPQRSIKQASIVTDANKIIISAVMCIGLVQNKK